MNKPLGRKNYGSIPHLPGSRIGPGDHHIHEGQGIICCERVRDKRDVVIVTEKLDGSNVGVARIGDDIVALGRAGWLAQSSPYEQHQLFAAWVRRNEDRFRRCLQSGERIVGEWLAQAHGTRYELKRDCPAPIKCPGPYDVQPSVRLYKEEPFVAFDVMRGEEHLPYRVFQGKASGFMQAQWIHIGNECPIAHALELLGQHGFHGAVDPVEGAVWRVERNGEFEFMAKYVRPDKKDGAYLSEVSGGEPVWNWRPDW